MASSFTKFSLLTHNRHNTVGRTPLDEWPARRRDPYLTTHNIHNRQTSMPPVGFEPTISVGALDRAATGIGFPCSFVIDIWFQCYFWNYIWQTFTKNWKWTKGATKQHNGENCGAHFHHYLFQHNRSSNGHILFFIRTKKTARASSNAASLQVAKN